MDEEVCPLCCEELETADLSFFPCSCGYQVCMFCWQRIRESGNGCCPGCRTKYTDQPSFKPPPKATPTAVATRGKARQTPAPVLRARSTGHDPSKEHLKDVRVVQRNLVYVIGLAPAIAKEVILRRNEYFGQYGKIVKVAVNKAIPVTAASGTGTLMSASAYITFEKDMDARSAILAVDGFVVEGRLMRASYGTTKYCHSWLRDQNCTMVDCLYLHDFGEAADSFTREEMLSQNAFGCVFQDVTQPKLAPELSAQLHAAAAGRKGFILPPPPPADAVNGASTTAVVDTAAAVALTEPPPAKETEASASALDKSPAIPLSVSTAQPKTAVVLNEVHFPALGPSSVKASDGATPMGVWARMASAPAPGKRPELVSSKSTPTVSSTPTHVTAEPAKPETDVSQRTEAPVEALEATPAATSKSKNKKKLSNRQASFGDTTTSASDSLVAAHVPVATVAALPAAAPSRVSNLSSDGVLLGFNPPPAEPRARSGPAGDIGIAGDVLLPALGTLLSEDVPSSLPVLSPSGSSLLAGPPLALQAFGHLRAPLDDLHGVHRGGEANLTSPSTTSSLLPQVNSLDHTIVSHLSSGMTSSSLLGPSLINMSSNPPYGSGISLSFPGLGLMEQQALFPSASDATKVMEGINSTSGGASSLFSTQYVAHSTTTAPSCGRPLDVSGSLLAHGADTLKDSLLSLTQTTTSFGDPLGLSRLGYGNMLQPPSSLFPLQYPAQPSTSNAFLPPSMQPQVMAAMLHQQRMAQMMMQMPASTAAPQSSTAESSRPETSQLLARMFAGPGLSASFSAASASEVRPLATVQPGADTTPGLSHVVHMHSGAETKKAAAAPGLRPPPGLSTAAASAPKEPDITVQQQQWLKSVFPSANITFAQPPIAESVRTSSLAVAQPAPVGEEDIEERYARTLKQLADMKLLAPGSAGEAVWKEVREPVAPAATAPADDQRRQASKRGQRR